MNRRQKFFTCGMLVILLLSCALFTNLLLAHTYARRQYNITSQLAGWMAEKHPEDEIAIIAQIKNTSSSPHANAILASYGFHADHFLAPLLPAALSGTFGCLLLFSVTAAALFFFLKSKTKSRIHSLTEYLIRINLKKEAPLLAHTEDDFSMLEDEIYKTVTELKTTKEAALQERQNFADSLANIAHQIKTPLTSISLSLQRPASESISTEHSRLREQLTKISRLTDALLTVSRIDAGALMLKQEYVDVYTMLELAIESLAEQIHQKNISVSLPYHADVSFVGDLGWSVEIFINLIKNCIEHTPFFGKLTFSYEKNPLYTEIILTDSGSGFNKQELPHLFRRFYCGKQTTASGTGIGLSIAKSIIELQNGLISADNHPDGGARFLIRFYCH